MIDPILFPLGFAIGFSIALTVLALMRWRGGRRYGTKGGMNGHRGATQMIERMKGIPRFLRGNKAYERNFEVGRFFGGFVVFPYQLALGISVSWLRCNSTRLFRVYFGPFKLWVNGKNKEVRDETQKGSGQD